MDYVERRMAQEAAKPAISPEVKTIFTPVNAILLSLLIYVLYKRLKPAPPIVLPPAPTPIVFKIFTPPTLLPFNGENNGPVYLAVRGKVFDVSSGRNFYGPGGPYENFAGKDASRGLAKSSFDEAMLTKNLEGPLDTLDDLNDEELETLMGWEERFNEKYLVVGKLISVDESKASKEVAKDYPKNSTSN
ncbi:hypothetical protein K3495_g7829 [Podosphaera aphanis]|nr:hypothetical protein K3495_g7829 [Podosphaera aphanis]